MGVGLTSLGHPWTGRRRPQNHYTTGIGDHTLLGTAGSRPPGPNSGGLLAIGRATWQGSCLALRDSASPTADLSRYRALLELRELRAGASTSRRYGPRTCQWMSSGPLGQESGFEGRRAASEADHMGTTVG